MAEKYSELDTIKNPAIPSELQINNQTSSNDSDDLFSKSTLAMINGKVIKIASNLLKTIEILSHPFVIITVVVLYIFILYPISVKASNIYPITPEYAQAILSSLSPLASFILGGIISNWASSKNIFK